MQMNTNEYFVILFTKLLKFFDRSKRRGGRTPKKIGIFPSSSQSEKNNKAEGRNSGADPLFRQKEEESLDDAPL